jgi:hypothetical protein
VSEKEKPGWMIFALALLLGGLGLSARLYLDKKFEELVPRTQAAEVGFLDSLMLDAADTVAEESKNE